MSQFNIGFDPQFGLQVSDTADILEAVQEEFKKCFGNDINLDPSSPQGQLISSLAAMIALKNTEILKVANQFNPLTAQGVFQDALGKIYFLERKVAQPTIVHCTCKGLSGTVIPVRALVQSADGTRFYAANESIIDESQSISVEFICEKDGAVEVAPHTVNKIITVVSGWDTVDNKNAGILGNINETQAEFERRRYKSVAKNAHGTVASLYGALADLGSVIDVVVLENTGNETISKAGVEIDGHSVYISVVGGTDAEIANVLYHKIDCGCGTTGDVPVTHIASDFHNATYVYNINRPAELPVYINVKIKQTDKTQATVIDDIKNAVVQNFNGLDNSGNARVKMAETLYSSRFYPVILGQNVQELLEVGVSSDNQNFTNALFIPANKFPVISEKNITVIMEKMA